MTEEAGQRKARAAHGRKEKEQHVSEIPVFTQPQMVVIRGTRVKGSRAVSAQVDLK